jgi:hypothetical protein
MFLLQLLIALHYFVIATDAMDRVAKDYRKYFGYVGLEWLHQFNSEIWLGGGEACARGAEGWPLDYSQCSFAWRLLLDYLDLGSLILAFSASGGAFLLIVRYVLLQLLFESDRSPGTRNEICRQKLASVSPSVGVI